MQFLCALSHRQHFVSGRSLWCGTALSFCVIAGLASGVTAAERERKVLMIGIDGLRPDAFVAANAPTMDSLVAQGAVCLNVQSEDISLSGPAWSTILSGVHRDKHLVTSNSFMPTNLGTYPHFFSRLQDVCPGVRTASIAHWAPINNNILLGSADVIQTHATDLAVRDGAVAQLLLPSSLGPDLMFLHFDDVDHAGHGFGFSPAVPQYIGAIEATDAHVAQIVAAMQSRPSFANEDWLIVICSDHGGSGTTHGANTPEQRTTMFAFSGASTQIGTTITGPRTLADIAPTVTAFLGVPIDSAWGWDGVVVGLNLANSPSQPVACAAMPMATLLSENFEGVPLGNSVNETPAGSQVWSGSPPTGWTFDDSGVPGNADPNIGMTEWKGWAIAQRDWWSTVAVDQGRAAFTRATGAVAIADCDEWADRGNPTAIGLFNARMRTPQISLAGVEGGVWLSFDSSWRQEAQQRALITVRYDGGAPIPVLDWRSAAGANFKPDATNEAVRLAIATPTNAQTMQLEFSLLDGGNNWWWAIDNVRIEGVRTCDSIDFNSDELFPDDQDLVDFLSVLAGGACSTGTCNDIDFNNDGLFPDDNDLVSFLTVLAGGTC